MKYIQCPAIFEGNQKSIFIAGGISDCSDWQKHFIELLKDTDLIIFNPKRAVFDDNIKNIEEEQIKWEFDHLKKADAVSFWFPHETLCPITLFELGKISKTNKKLFVGIDPEYKRKKDIEIQIGLERPEVKIVYSLCDLANQIQYRF